MRETGSFAAREGEAFTAVSRGDLVAGRLWCSSAPGSRPLVLITPPLDADKHARAVEVLVRALCREGLAAAAIDLPLQGERANAKLSARLLRCARQRERSASDQLLWDEFLRQSALDLEAARAALAGRAGLRAERIGCVAFEPGAAAAVAWAARDAHVRACLPASPDADPERIARDLREQLA